MSGPNYGDSSMCNPAGPSVGPMHETYATISGRRSPAHYSTSRGGGLVAIALNHRKHNIIHRYMGAISVSAALMCAVEITAFRIAVS